MSHTKIYLFAGCCLVFISGFGQSKIDPDYFKSIPKEIDGCGGFYTYDSLSIKKEKYIFITNLQELALMTINHAQISLKLSSRSNPTKNTYKEIYTGHGYTVILTTKEVKPTGDEVSLYSGTLEIIFQKSKRIIKIHGEAGC